MKPENVRKVLTAFSASPRVIRRPSDARLASVYLIDDLYVLRSRVVREDTCERFTSERKLLRAVAGLTGYSFPQYLASVYDRDHVIHGARFWTLHRLIPGPGPWETGMNFTRAPLRPGRVSHRPSA